MTSQRHDLIAAVDQSPAAAGNHDRAGWVGLFTPNGRIEDPVGARPHVGIREIECFYDTFIGPRDITFHRNFDIVSCATVIRDLDLEVSVSPTRSMVISAVLRYDLEITGDIVRINRLRAYWELPTMMLQFVRLGAVAVPTGITLTSSLIRNQKISGTIGFARGFRSPGRRGKAVATTFVEHVGAGRNNAADSLLRGAVTANDGELLTTDELADRLRGALVTRVIAADRTVVVSAETAQGHAVVFADIATRHAAIDRIHVVQASGAVTA
jgi:hypothetical protein